MGRKLYVGNLPFRFDDDALRELFTGVGQVAFASIVKDHATGRARGFGFVEMMSDEDAQKAISQLHQHEVDGRALVVNEARPRERREPGSDDRRPPRTAGSPPPQPRPFRSAPDEPAPFEKADRNFGKRGSRKGFGAKRDRGARRDDGGFGRSGRPGRGPGSRRVRSDYDEE